MLKIWVVVPFYNESDDWLRQCLASIAGQSVRCQTLVVSDAGRESPVFAEHSPHVLRFPFRSNDWGDTPRSIGALLATSQGADAVTWLDADNWWEPLHLQSLVALHEQTGAAICTSARTLYHINGTRLGRCYETDGESFVDANCLLLFRPALRLTPHWSLLPAQAHTAGDRIFWDIIRRSAITRAHTGLPTVAYRTRYRVHYDHFGVPAPADVKETVFS